MVIGDGERLLDKDVKIRQGRTAVLIGGGESRMGRAGALRTTWGVECEVGVEQLRTARGREGTEDCEGSSARPVGVFGAAHCGFSPSGLGMNDEWWLDSVGGDAASRPR